MGKEFDDIDEVEKMLAEDNRELFVQTLIRIAEDIISKDSGFEYHELLHDNLDTENKPVVNNEEEHEEERMMKKDNDIRGISDVMNIPEDVINSIVASNTTNDTTINMAKFYPDEDIVKDMSVEDMIRDICEKAGIDEEGTEKLISRCRNNRVIDATESSAVIMNTPDNLTFNEGNTSNSTPDDDVIKDMLFEDTANLRKLIKEIINRDLVAGILNLDYIEPAQCNAYINHIMCHTYEVNPDIINDRFSGRLDISFISDRSMDNIVSITVSNFIKCYTKSNIVKMYNISYDVLVWCYLDGYDTNRLIKYILNHTTRRFISDFKFNEIDDTVWSLPTTMRHIKKIANKYPGLIKYSNTKFSNGTGKVSIRNMSFNLGEDMNTAVSEFNNEFSDLDDEEEE